MDILVGEEHEHEYLLADTTRKPLEMSVTDGALTITLPAPLPDKIANVIVVKTE